MTSFNQELIDEINLLRADPVAYAEKVTKYLGYFKGKTLTIPGGMSISTREGKKAFELAIEFLKKQTKLPAYTVSEGLNKIAEEIYTAFQDMHPKFDNTDMKKIIEKYGSFTGGFQRSMDFGGNNAEVVVVNLLVCDGDKNRGERETLLGKKLTQVGVATGPNKNYRTCSVIVSTGAFKEK